MDVNLTTTMGMIIAMHKASRMRHGSKAITEKVGFESTYPSIYGFQKKVRSSFVSELLSNELFLAIVLLSCYRYYLMNLLDEVFQIDEVISEGDTPVESFEWVLGKVLCLNVTIHTDVIEDVLQIAFLL